MKDEEIANISRQIADSIGDMLQQECKQHNGEWWLWSLGKPQRPLTPDEIQESIEDGEIPRPKGDLI